MAKRAGRQKNQLPQCYYEGYLEKRSFKDKTSRKLWTSLCGTTLFFYNEKKDADYVEKMDLSGLISVSDDGTWDRNLDAARFNLQHKDGEIKFTAPNPEARELWKGFIHSVTELSIPSSLNLLPGQVHMLKEAIEKETERVNPSSSSYLPPPVPGRKPNISVQDDLPACFFNVSRQEAELLLERETQRGNLLLRHSKDGVNFAVSTRQDLDGAIFKHYHVIRELDGSFAIDVDVPVPCATLHDVITYLVEKTDKVLIPLIMEGPYEKNISFIRPDNESGELSSVQCAPSIPPPSLPPKLVSLREAEPLPHVDECLYLNDLPEEDEEEEEEEEEVVEEAAAVVVKDGGKKTGESSSIFHLPKPGKKAPRKAIMPPIPAPRRISPPILPIASLSASNAPEKRPRSNTDSMLQTMSELRLTLEKRGMCAD
ncbi:signal-transducing adaptor protein 1-like isoform X2 [Genypterus blacodes]|uniref:signal-transducing adaptor protein 1-like isoform X2 n=1 Tax=Genypterus blacodes TaxID=154954 RepID=UPI003F75CD0A